MSIESALERQNWQLEQKTKWIAVKDERDAFQSAFSTSRVGKLIGSKFYVVPQELQAAAARHILALGLTVERITSTSGRDREYLGFDSDGQQDETLFALAEQLHREVQKRVQK